MALTQRKIARHYGNLKAQVAQLRMAVESAGADGTMLLVTKDGVLRTATMLDEIATDLLTALPDTHALSVPAEEPPVLPIEQMSPPGQFECPTHGWQESNDCPTCVAEHQG